MRLHRDGGMYGWALIGGVGAISLAMTLMEQNLGELFRYERAAILQGELWRLVSGHLVHAGPAHWLMNMAALGLMCLLFPTVVCGRWAVLLLFSLCLMTSLGLILFYPQLGWFVGLSGVLHGLFAVGALQTLSVDGKRGWGLLALLLLKLVYEQLGGEVPGSQSLVGIRVLTEAHLVGALAGVIYWLVSSINWKQKDNGP